MFPGGREREGGRVLARAGHCPAPWLLHQDQKGGGRSATTVHVPGDSAWYVNDATVQVLVDPQDAGYAEFPGQPLTTSTVPWGTVIPLLAGLILFGQAIPRARKRLREMAALRGGGDGEALFGDGPAG